MANKLDLADAQFTGYTTGYAGYSIVSLVESMGLKRSEWLKLRENYYFTESQRFEVDNYFKLNNNGK